MENAKVSLLVDSLRVYIDALDMVLSTRYKIFKHPATHSKDIGLP